MQRIAITLLCLATVGVAFAGEPVVLDTHRGRPFSECPGGTGKTVTLNCTQGSDGSAAGEFGGAGFSLGCHTDRSQTTFCSEPGNDNYSLIILTTSQNGSTPQCFLTGDRSTVAARCGDVLLTIR
jgi:hypothetical protein